MRNQIWFGLSTISTLCLLAGCPSSDDAIDGEGGTLTVCSSDADCNPGLECEVEHGSGFCKAHGGDDDQSGGTAGLGGSDDDGSDDKGNDADDDHGSAGEDATDDAQDADAAAMACTTDADCPANEECELEHGSSFCKPHGGRGR